MKATDPNVMLHKQVARQINNWDKFPVVVSYTTPKRPASHAEIISRMLKGM